jgi:hypothetical protein
MNLKKMRDIYKKKTNIEIHFIPEKKSLNYNFKLPKNSFFLQLSHGRKVSRFTLSLITFLRSLFTPSSALSS